MLFLLLIFESVVSGGIFGSLFFVFCFSVSIYKDSFFMPVPGESLIASAKIRSPSRT